MRQFVHCITSLVDEGMHLQAIVRHIRAIREEFTAELFLKLKADLHMYSGQILTQSDIALLSSSTVVTLVTYPIPTNDILTRCVIINFLENESFYKSEMQQVKVEQCLHF